MKFPKISFIRGACFLVNENFYFGIVKTSITFSRSLNESLLKNKNMTPSGLNCSRGEGREREIETDRQTDRDRQRQRDKDRETGI